MSGYTKLFSSILASTIWREPDHVRVVWITMLAMVNKSGVVEASVPGLADMARVSLEKCEEALAILRAPDKYSRTKENDGRRIHDIDGGFLLLNHGKYRDMMSAEDRREYQRAYRSKYREEGRDKSRSTVGQHLSTRSTVGQSLSCGSIHTAPSPYITLFRESGAKAPATQRASELFASEQIESHPGTIFNEVQRATRLAQIDRIKRIREQRSTASRLRWNKSNRNATAMQPQSGPECDRIPGTCSADIREESGEVSGEYPSSPLSPHSITNIKEEGDNIGAKAPATQRASELFASEQIESRTPRFQKPTFEELKAMMGSEGLPVIEAEKFFNHYESNGWRVGKNPMKSLPHAIRNWKLRLTEHGTHRAGNHQNNNRNQGTLNDPNDYGG